MYIPAISNPVVAQRFAPYEWLKWKQVDTRNVYLLHVKSPRNENLQGYLYCPMDKIFKYHTNCKTRVTGVYRALGTWTRDRQPHPNKMHIVSCSLPERSLQLLRKFVSNFRPFRHFLLCFSRTVPTLIFFQNLSYKCHVWFTGFIAWQKLDHLYTCTHKKQQKWSKTEFYEQQLALPLKKSCYEREGVDGTWTWKQGVENEVISHIICAYYIRMQYFMDVTRKFDIKSMTRDFHRLNLASAARNSRKGTSSSEMQRDATNGSSQGTKK